MAYEQRPDSGTLFKNDKKTQPNHPDYRGEGNINGHKFEISAWIKEGKRGKFMSLAFKPPYRKPQASTEQQPDLDTSSVPTGAESDVPF
jgi:hypothetical protein